MPDKKKTHQKPTLKNAGGQRKEKPKLHPRSKHTGRYEFKQLVDSNPELADYVKMNKFGDESIDFANPKAVKSLNKALLLSFYKIGYWDIPQDYLCPPIPGRADYVHHMADLLQSSNYGNLPVGEKIKVLDIGVGANCIYPIIGVSEYNWSFLGSDIDPVAIEWGNKIISSNPGLESKIELKLQKNPNDYFYGIIRRDDQIDFSICNPPFHASAAEAQSGTKRKLKNLSRETPVELVKNFGGQSIELWCEGGEKRFVSKMVRESQKFATSCFWFSSLVSKESNLKSIYEAIKRAGAKNVRTIPMSIGNKTSRILAWTFLAPAERKKWIETRWQ